MGRRYCLHGILLTFLVALFPMGARGRPKSVSAYDGTVGFGAQLLRLGDGCVSVDGTVTSGDFFDDLRRIDVRGQLEYSKHGRAVTEYPASLIVSIRMVGDGCATGLASSPSSIFHGDSYAVKFTVEWKDGMGLRPAALSLGAARCVGYSSATIPGGTPTIPTLTCQMTVDSRGVSLADHLIVSIFSADGKRITRISAAP